MEGAALLLPFTPTAPFLPAPRLSLSLSPSLLSLLAPSLWQPEPRQTLLCTQRGIRVNPNPNSGLTLTLIPRPTLLSRSRARPSSAPDPSPSYIRVAP